VTHGDGTVPEESASRVGFSNLNAPGAKVWYYFSLTDNADEFVEHTALTQLAQVQDRVLFILGKGPDPGEGDTISRVPPRAKTALLVKTLEARNLGWEPEYSVLKDKRKSGVRSFLSHHSLFDPSRGLQQLFEATKLFGTAPGEPPKAEAYYLRITGIDYLRVSDELGNSNTQIDDTFTVPVPNVTYNLMSEKAVFVSTPSDKRYTINFQTGTEPLNLEVLRGTDNTEPSQAFRYRDIELPSNINAVMSFGPGGVENLRYDSNGDGVFESTLSPTVILIGGAAADVTPPAVDISGESQQTRVQVFISGQDPESGVKSIYYSTDQVHYQLYSEPLSVDPSQIRKISSFADDYAGNRSSISTYDVPRPPSITAPSDQTVNTEPGDSNCGVTINDAVLGNPAAISNSSGTVTVRRSGIPANNLFPVGITRVTYTAADSNGLTATALQTISVIDKTTPTIICPSNISILLPANSSATSINLNYPSPSASDNCSGSIVNSVPVSGSVFDVGTTWASAIATDASGNVTSCVFSVSLFYRFAGLFPPVSNWPTFNSVNAGRAIPIQFSLSGNKGFNIFAAGPASGPIGCSSTSEVELTDTVTTGNSGLSYDAQSDHYVYVWKTESSWAGTCRQFVIQLNDGTIQRANFKFR